MGPEAGANGRRVVAPGTILDIAQNKNLQIGPFLAGTADVHVRDRAKPVELFDLGTIHLSTGAIHTVKPLDVDIPKGRLAAVGGQTLPELMAMDVNTALEVCKDMKLASEMGRAPAGARPEAAWWRGRRRKL